MYKVVISYLISLLYTSKACWKANLQEPTTSSAQRNTVMAAAGQIGSEDNSGVSGLVIWVLRSDVAASVSKD
jgi:hypothetical protein